MLLWDACSWKIKLTGNAFIVTILPENAERRCETAFPVRTFLILVIESRRPRAQFLSLSYLRRGESVIGVDETHCGKAGIFTLASTSGMPGSRGASVDGLSPASFCPLSAWGAMLTTEICSNQKLYRKTVKMMGKGKSSMRCRQLGSLVRPTESGRSPPPTLRGKLLTSPASGNLLFDAKPTAGAAGLGMGKPQLSLGQRPPHASAHSNRRHPGMSTCHRKLAKRGPEAIGNVPVMCQCVPRNST